MYLDGEGCGGGDEEVVVGPRVTHVVDGCGDEETFHRNMRRLC